MRLRTRQQYRRMAHQSIKLTGQWILIDFRLSKYHLSRLGITVTRRYGMAHQRNRFKRLVKESFRLLRPHLSFNFDIVVRPRSQALKASQKDIQEELLQLLQKANGCSG